MAKLIYDAGINDGTRPSKMNGKHLPQYEMWRGMIRRCYSLKERDKFPAYLDCEVSENFKSYSYFYDWYSVNVVDKSIKYELDKDLLVKGNRIYSESLCLLIPSRINSLIMLKKCQRGDCLIGVSYNKARSRFQSQISIDGKNKTIGYFKSEVEAYMAYKQAKEAYVKDMANKWRESISCKAYNALMNYTVEITD